MKGWLGFATPPPQRETDPLAILMVSICFTFSGYAIFGVAVVVASGRRGLK
jgi:hypothetical protein